MRIHLLDGTYELFRAYFGAPAAKGPDGAEVGATRGLLRSLLALLRSPGVSHVGFAFDHVIESFRNDLFPGYKTSAGVSAELLAQFPLAERAARALGIAVWPMLELEADDALATAAARWAGSRSVEQILIGSPDKDLAQCVRGRHVVCFDRRQRRLLDEEGVWAKFGVAPASIPDWLALVGDSADGYPGVPGWGARSAAALLARHRHIDAIPDDERDWAVSVRGAASLAGKLRKHRREAQLYRRLALLRTDAPIAEDLEDLRWRGARRDELGELCRLLGEEDLIARVPRWRA